MNQRSIQKLADRAANYARQHPQTVRLSWVSRKVTTSTAESAVELCADPLVAARLMGTVADDKTLEDMLNRLIDRD